MHTRVFQLENNKGTDREELEYMEEFFERQDEVEADDADFQNSIDMMVNALPDGSFTYNPEEQSITFNPGFEEAYFEKSFKKMKELVQSMTLVEFSRDSDQLLDLKQAVNSQFDYYAYSSASMLESFDTFVRNLEEHGEERTFFIKTIYDVKI